MNTYPVIYKSKSHLNSRRKRYSVVILFSYSLIAALAILYLKQEPVYQSTMSLVLPGSGSSSNFSIEDIGQANSQTRLPFGGGDFNPRINYREIIKSRNVRQNAADSLSVDIASLGLPRIELPQQSSILSVSLTSASPEHAQNKAWAIYEAFQGQLDQLRADESRRHTDGVQRALKQYEFRVHNARQDVVEFQQRSLIISSDQLTQSTLTLNQVEEKMLYAQSELQSRKEYVRQLGQDLGVSPSLAGQAFALNTDSQFRGYLRELDTSSAQLSEFSAKWGKNHPKVRAEKKRVENAQHALFTRSVSIVGQQTAERLHTLDLTVSANRSELFADLIDNYALIQADKAKIRNLEFEQQRLHDRLKIFARETAELERLERAARLAEAVYTSAAARLDASKVDIFASYPVVQMLTSPSIPKQQKSPKLSIAIAGALAGLIFISIGVLILWQRQVIIAQLLKKN